MLTGSAVEVKFDWRVGTSRSSSSTAHVIGTLVLTRLAGRPSDLEWAAAGSGPPTIRGAEIQVLVLVPSADGVVVVWIVADIGC